MRHIYLILFIIGFCDFMFAQIDTIKVSKDYKTILVLPEPYSFSINGKDLNFIESFPKSTSEKADHIVMLAYNNIAPDKQDYTNYTVYTKNGLAYDFILDLVAIPETKRWNITKDMADNFSEISLSINHSEGTDAEIIKNEDTALPNDIDILTNGREENFKITPLSTSLYEEDRIAYLKQKCKNHISDKGNIARYFSKVGDIFIWLKGVYYDREELYFLFTLENKEPIDLDINFLKTFIGTNYKQSSSNQKSEFQPLFRYGQPTRVKGNTSASFVLIFEKFTLDKNKHLVLELDELNGNRNISLDIEHQLINRPKKFGK
ncbi:DUF4138 domain-containing protein [Maribacter arenosus]|uniref:DUF4138 domain-containing protein n=1 Tax=Maribacter arenosus TaxID=1854708 RepID=A0ABR7VE84_9FLAO|nr:DUF4138 domain-containing protein [Maribacter arenosus]MBD0851947.1 DUF4138 domain-containing protein [Maribacter arenosus]